MLLSLSFVAHPLSVGKVMGSILIISKNANSKMRDIDSISSGMHWPKTGATHCYAQFDFRSKDWLSAM